MARLTSDPNDPDLTHGQDDEPVEQAQVYLVDSGEGEFVRPVRHAYIHSLCGKSTTMSQALAETYARDPKFYGATYCVFCRMHRPVAEFEWYDGTVVGS